MKEEILSELNNLVVEIETMCAKYGAEDCRTSFLSGYFESLKVFYCSYYHLETIDILDKYSEIYNKQVANQSQIEYFIDGYRNILRSSLLINIWSEFELFCSLFCNAVLEPSEVNKLLDNEYNQLIRILKNNDLSSSVQSKLEKCKKNSLTHVSITHKYNKLLKKIKPYPSSQKKDDDIKFLRFMGTLRNCIHSNFVFYGNDFVYTFNNVQYIFKNGFLLKQTPARDLDILIIIDQLKTIFYTIIDNITFEKEIIDPSYSLIKQD